MMMTGKHHFQITWLFIKNEYKKIQIQK
jgi:hypothetical protein